MLREVLGNSSGQIVRSDTSFRVAGKTMTTSAVKGLAFQLGEDGKVQRYGGVKSESRKKINPLLVRCVSIFVAWRSVFVLSRARCCWCFVRREAFGWIVGPFMPWQLLRL